MKKSYCALLILNLFACSVQKRTYTNGYYVNWHRNHNTTEPYKLPDSKKITFKNTTAKSEKVQIERQFASKSETSSTPSFYKVSSGGNDSCDVLIFKDGAELTGKVIEINSDIIKYKRCDYLEGPSYVVKKSEVFMIKHANGIRELIKTETEFKTGPSESDTAPNPQINNPVQNSNSQTGKPSVRLHLNIAALFSFIFGVIGIIFGIGLLSTLLGAKALREIQDLPTYYYGKTLAEIGRKLGHIKLVIVGIIALLIILAMLAS